MNDPQSISTDALHKKENYSISSVEEEIRADRHCAALLQRFYQYLLQEQQIEPLEAGALASGADYFLREYIIGDRRENILEISAVRIRQFGSNWYIIKNLEPNMEELTDMMSGTDAFYRYCTEQKLFPKASFEQISAECSKLSDFAQRIEDFHDISGGGYKLWDQACPLN